MLRSIIAFASTIRRGVAAYKVERGPDGTAVETRIEPRLLNPADW
jgi:hypothetical protein